MRLTSFRGFRKDDTKPGSPMVAHSDSLKSYLDEQVRRFERQSFIESDPVSIPHAFDSRQDREVIGLFSALLAWGRRDILLRNLEDLCERMNLQPAQFVTEFDEHRDGHRLDGFVHRTFNSRDAVCLCLSLREIFRSFGSIEQLCAEFLSPTAETIQDAVQGLSETLFSISPGMPSRMRKHLARPSTGSACKRLCLYFRWMVRPGPVDLGIWKSIHPRQLIVPLDVHSGRQARTVGLISRPANDWRSALELTEKCRIMHPEDPVRYDFAFFGTGAAGEILDADYADQDRSATRSPTA